MDTPSLTADPNQVIILSWIDNSGQGKAKITDELLVVYAPDLHLFQIFEAAATRDLSTVALTLPSYMAGETVETWATFVTMNGKEAAISSYLGPVMVQ